MTDVWIEITNGTYKGVDFHIANPNPSQRHGATNVQQTRPRRLQKIKRPFVDGQRIKDLGRDGRQISVDIIFFGDNYLSQLQQFLDVLEDGQSGILILPDDGLKTFAAVESVELNSRANETRSKTIRVTWTEDTKALEDDTASGAVDGLLETSSLLDSANKLQEKVNQARETINNNDIVNTIRDLETVTSVASTAFIEAAGLSDEARNSVLGGVSNIQQSLTQALNAKDRLLSVFGLVAPTSGFGVEPVDSATGNPIGDGLDDDDLEIAADPLARPEPEATETINVGSLETNSSVDKFESDFIGLVDKNDSTLQNVTQGRTNDITDSLVEVKNALRDLVASVRLQRTKLVQTPIDLSLPEVLFHNGIDVENLMDVYRRNSFIEDINNVPRGTVVEL